MITVDGTASDMRLRLLKPIETIEQVDPTAIVLREVAVGPFGADSELMEARVRWAVRATFTVLSHDIPQSFAPYNAVIRISDRGTEDFNRDYLAMFAPPSP